MLMYFIEFYTHNMYVTCMWMFMSVHAFVFVELLVVYLCLYVCVCGSSVQLHMYKCMSTMYVLIVLLAMN